MIFLKHDKPFFKCKENSQYDEHIPHQTQKCNDMHLTVQAEIVNIDSVHPADFEKCREFVLVSSVIDIFINYYDVEARCAIFTTARFLIKITSISQTESSDFKHF